MRKLGITISKVRESQGSGTVGTKALEWDHAWQVSRRARSVVSLEQRERIVVGITEINGERWPANPLGPVHILYSWSFDEREALESSEQRSDVTSCMLKRDL